MTNLLTSLVEYFLTGAQRLFDLVFGDIDFSVLWGWLPADIASACSTLVVLLFAFAFIAFMQKVIPF